MSALLLWVGISQRHTNSLLFQAAHQWPSSGAGTGVGILRSELGTSFADIRREVGPIRDCQQSLSDIRQTVFPSSLRHCYC